MPPDRPAVTVLIGAYDNELTLPRAIASILAQTESNLELIVIDDGSRDRSAAVAREEIGSDQRGRVMRLERNVGIARSLNAGLRAAAAPGGGDPGRRRPFGAAAGSSAQLAVLDSDPRVAVVGTRMREVDAAGRIAAPADDASPPGTSASVLLRFNPIPNSSAAFRREPALALGGYDPRYRYAPDHDLWLRLAERHRVVALDEELSTRVMGGENVAARAERASIAEALAIRARALRRRRTLRGAGGLVRPAISYLVPIRAKRALRTLRGQAP